MGEKFTIPDNVSSELSPGSTQRRWVPPGGEGKHNAKIHKESRIADKHKNLPFAFSKPLKPKGRPLSLVCNNCGAVTGGTTATVGVICKSCGKFSAVTQLE